MWTRWKLYSLALVNIFTPVDLHSPTSLNSPSHSSKKQLSFLPHILSLTRTAFFCPRHTTHSNCTLSQMQPKPLVHAFCHFPPGLLRRTLHRSPHFHYLKDPAHSEFYCPHTDPDETLTDLPHLTDSGHTPICLINMFNNSNNLHLYSVLPAGKAA